MKKIEKWKGVKMNRKKFIKYINKEYSFESTERINGTHEIFKSPYYKFNFSIPKGKKEIKKGIYWEFQKLIKNEENKINSKKSSSQRIKKIESDK